MIKVTYIDHLGNDLTIVNAARVSFNSESEELTDKDKKLIKYLADHEHMSPFEHCVLTVSVECPLYIRSQIHRHRTFAYNEVSRRYTSENLEFYEPSRVDLRQQSKSNRQASEGVLEYKEAETALEAIRLHHARSEVLYQSLLDMGVCREQARGILPQNLMTKFFMTGNLRNWVHFIELRTHAGAQKEVQGIAEKVKELLLEKFPEATRSLFKDACD